MCLITGSAETHIRLYPPPSTRDIALVIHDVIRCLMASPITSLSGGEYQRRRFKLANSADNMPVSFRPSLRLPSSLLTSASSSPSVIRHICLSTIGDRAFPVAA